MTDEIDRALPGYEAFEIPTPQSLLGTEDWSEKEWKREFQKTQSELWKFLSARDPFVVLARTVARLLIERDKLPNDGDQLEQAHAEIIQAMILMRSAAATGVPTSPNNFVRFWSKLVRHTHSFTRHQSKGKNLSDVQHAIQQRARLQTLYYRNLFDRKGCELVLQGVLAPMDAQSIKTLGYKLSDLFRACVRIADLVGIKLNEYIAHVVTLLDSKDRQKIDEAIEFLRACHPLCEKVWDRWGGMFTERETRGKAAFQLSELGYPWVFTLTKEQLENEFSPEVIEAIYKLALSLGDLSDANPDFIYLNNPIWRRPYIDLGNGELYVGVPQLVFSFPFAIVEGIIEDHPELRKAYEDSRSEYLEQSIAEIVSTAIPSATVHRGVFWYDPASPDKRLENDVVAFVGNYVFVFEAKSGRLNDVSRRGGELSLTKDFKELFVEPGYQGWRLQNYIDEQQNKVKLFAQNGKPLSRLGFDRPKVVARFSVCFEHFASLTSASLNLKELGIINETTAWAPVLSLGELQMVGRFLDTEVSFVHYFSRRSTLEQSIDLEGDEQDILSMYLTNGFCVDQTVAAGKRIQMVNADGLVRQAVVPRENRTEFLTHGVQLPPLWSSIVKEIYENTGDRHRFDYVSVIMNQTPAALMGIEKQIRRFRRGVPTNENDTMVVKFVVGRKLFLLACHLAKSAPKPDEWTDFGRNLVYEALAEYDMVECVAFYFLRRSKERTFDGVSFFRYGKRPKPSI